MRAIALSITFAMLTLVAAPAAAGIWGATDQVPAASLVLPFFEVGIDPGTNPHDTLPIVYNRSVGSLIIHFEVWSIDGEQTFGGFGNVTIPSAGTWSGSLRDIIAGASASDRALLTQGAFYRGFMTIDVVTATTSQTPFEVGYPFGTENGLIGYAYFVRLLEGSANGLAMIPLEHTDTSGVPARLEGFYGETDHREEIDVNARTCAASLTQGETVDDYLFGCNSNTDATVNIRTRVFQSVPLSGNSRVVVFAWSTDRPFEGGPSAICADIGGCATSYTFSRVLADGSTADSGTLALNHVVTVIDTAAGTVGSGEFLIFGVEDPGSALQLFAFSFNAASPKGNPDQSWDAIFEGNIEP